MLDRGYECYLMTLYGSKSSFSRPEWLKLEGLKETHQTIEGEDDFMMINYYLVIILYIIENLLN